MSKHNLFTKKLKKQFLSINDSIESYFSKLKFIIFNLKKTKFNKNNRVFLASSAIVILTLTYLLIPTFFDKDIVETQIKNQIIKRYEIDLKLNEKIEYRLLPKPHFFIRNSTILRKKKEIAIVKNLQIYIAINKFFSGDKIEIKNLIFKNTDFNIHKEDFIFFKKLLETEPNDYEIIIKDSNIFFKNNDDDVLFINKIFNSKFYYDFVNLKNVLSAKNEIFNVPFKLTVKNDKFNKKISSKFDSSKIRLNIENEIDYDEEIKKGLINLLFVNKNSSFNYQIKKNEFSFDSDNNKNTYSGLVFFKPFYFSAEFNYDGISTRNLFNDDTIFMDLIKSEILTNKNINAAIDLNVKDITNIDELNNLNLKIAFSQGDIGFSNSHVKWKDDLNIKLLESLLTYNDNYEVSLTGKLNLNFENLENFYRSFQIKKNHRKKIKEIEIDFIYNFNQKKVNFDNVKINNESYPLVEKYIENFNNSENRIFNKITFKNFVNNFFVAYAG